MIAVDTSALLAILLDEPEAEACMDVLEAADGHCHVGQLWLERTRQAKLACLLYTSPSPRD